MFNKKSRISVLVGLSFLLIFFLPFSIILQTDINQKEPDYNVEGVKSPKKSGYWDENDVSFIHIDNNWSLAASNLAWVQGGDGSWGDPYLIENVTINAGGSGSGILIENSNDYFIIRNCTVYNSGWNWPGSNAGIKLQSVSNGTLINNNVSNNNGNGIDLDSSDNNTISGNTVNSNYGGIYIIGGGNNTLSGNTADNNFYGIYLSYSDNNTVSGNTAHNNTYGISLLGSNNNTLSGNNMTRCDVMIWGFLEQCISHKIDTTNLVNDKPVYYYVSEIGLGTYNFTYAGDAGQVILANCSNSNVSNLNLSYASLGISLLYSDNNTVSGNTAHNNTYGGIYLSYSDNNTVSGNNASNNKLFGIYLHYSDNNTVSGNTADNNFLDGIRLENSDNNTVSGNTANNNTYEGIYLSYSNNNTLSGNNMTLCGVRIWGFLEQYISHKIDTTNLVNDKPVYYYVNEIGLGTDNFTYAGDAGQVILANCSNSNVSNLNLSYASLGISLLYSDNNTVSGNTLNNNDIGIYLENSDNNTVSGNNASNNKQYGIYLRYSNNNTVSGNNASNNSDTGICLWGSNNNTVSGNTAHNNTYGISLYGSNNTVSGNTAQNNNYGISLENNYNTTVSENTLNNNDIGIYIYYSSYNNISGNIIRNNYNSGVSISDNNSLYNLFYNNSFIGNQINAIDNGTVNYWNNSVIGNYWEDYLGKDVDDDGIGDSVYVIQGYANSYDNKPIWWDPPVLSIISPSTNEYFSNKPPNFVVSLEEGINDTTWYSLNGGNNLIFEGSIGTINQNAWDALGDGTVTIRFSVNDTRGYIGFHEVSVIKDTTLRDVQFPVEMLIIIISIIAVVALGITGAVVWKKKTTIPKKEKVKITEEERKEKERKKIEAKKIKILKDLQKRMSFVDNLIKENKLDLALKNLVKIQKEAQAQELIDIVNKAEEKIIYCKKLEVDSVNRIKRTILTLGAKFTRLQLTEISERSGIKDAILIESVIQDMIRNKEIYGDYFSSSKSLALEATTPVPTEEKVAKLNVFISYSTLDTNYFQISKIVRRLELYPEINEVLFWEVDSKQNIVEFMEETLKKSNVFVLFCSEHSMKSASVKDEWQAAFQRRKKGLIKMIPVYENEEDIPAMLGHILNVKFDKTDFESFIENLYKEILR